MVAGAISWPKNSSTKSSGKPESGSISSFRSYNLSAGDNTLTEATPLYSTPPVLRSSIQCHAVISKSLRIKVPEQTAGLSYVSVARDQYRTAFQLFSKYRPKFKFSCKMPISPF